MADRSDDHGASDDDDGASQEMPFQEVLHEMLGIIADALADGIESGITPTSIIVAIKSLISSFAAAM
jgi:hypothetical protein